MSRRTSARATHTSRAKEREESTERDEITNNDTQSSIHHRASTSAVDAASTPSMPVPACFRGTLSLFSSTPEQSADECHMHPVGEIRMYASNASTNPVSALCQSCTARADQNSSERLLGWNNCHRSSSSSKTSSSIASTPLPSCCLSRDQPFDSHHLCFFAEIPVSDFTTPQQPATVKTQSFIAMCQGHEASFIPANLTHSDDDGTIAVTHLVSSAATEPQQPDCPFTPLHLGNRTFLNLLADLRRRKTVGLIHFGGAEFAPPSTASNTNAISHRSPRSFEFGFLFPLSVNTAAIKLVPTAADLAHFFVVHSQLHNRIATRVRRHVLEHYNLEAETSSSRYSSSLLKQKLNQFDWRSTKQQPHQSTTTMSLPAMSDLISKPVDPFALLPAKPTSIGGVTQLATYPPRSQLFVRSGHASSREESKQFEEEEMKDTSWHAYESLLRSKLPSTAPVASQSFAAASSNETSSSHAAAAALISSSSSSSEDENEDLNVNSNTATGGAATTSFSPERAETLSELVEAVLGDASTFLEVSRPLHRICDFFASLTRRVEIAYNNDQAITSRDSDDDIYMDLAPDATQFPKPARAPVRPPAATSKRFLLFTKQDTCARDFETRLVLSMLRRKAARAELSNLTITVKDSDAEKMRKEQVNKDYEEYKKRYVTFQLHIMLLYVFPNTTKLDSTLLFPTKKAMRANASSSPPRSPNSISVSLETEFKDFVRMLPLSVDKADFIIQVLSIPSEEMMKAAAETMITRDKFVAAVLQERVGGDRGVDPSLAQSIRHWKSLYYAPPIADEFFSGARYSEITLQCDLTDFIWDRRDSVAQLASLASDWDVKPEQNIAKRWLDDWKAFLAEVEICQNQPQVNKNRPVMKEGRGAAAGATAATKTMSKAEAEAMNKLAKQAFPDSMPDVSLSLPKPGYGKNRGTSKVDIARAVAAAKTAATEAAAAADAARAKQRQQMSAPLERSTQCSSLFFGARSRIQIDTKVRVLKSPTRVKKPSAARQRTPGSGGGSGGKGKKRERERTPSGGSAKKKAPGSAQKKARLTHSPARAVVVAAAAASTPVRSSPRLMMQQQLAVGISSSASPQVLLGSPSFRSPLRLAHGSPLIVAETPAQESLFHASPGTARQQPRASARKVARGLDFSGAGSANAAAVAGSAGGLPLRLSSRAAHCTAPKRQLEFSSPQKQRETNNASEGKVNATTSNSPTKADKKRVHSSMNTIMAPPSAPVPSSSSSSSSPASAFASPSLNSPVHGSPAMSGGAGGSGAVVVQATPSPGDEVIPRSNPNSNQSSKSRPSGSSTASGSARNNNSSKATGPSTAQRSLFAVTRTIQETAPQSSLSSLHMRDFGGRAIKTHSTTSQRQQAAESHESPKKKQKLLARALSMVAEEEDSSENMHDVAQNVRVTPRKAARETSTEASSAAFPPPASSLSGLSFGSSYPVLPSTSSPPTVTVQGAASKRVIGVASAVNSIGSTSKTNGFPFASTAMETAKGVTSFNDLFAIPSLTRTTAVSRNVATKNAHR